MKNEDSQSFPLISIITVVYQGEKGIIKTLDSVYRQTSKAFEYVIIDGNSKDATVSIIQQHLPKYDEKNIAVVFKSEKDKGIYDAMNKAVFQASGKWIIFMNAGDTFYEENTLEQLEEMLKIETCDVVHGNECLIESGEAHIAESCKSAELMEGNVLFHQSTFVRREVLEGNPFSLEYRIAGDYEFFLRLQQRGFVFRRINNVIANFMCDGISSTHPITCLKEKTKIRKQYNCIKQSNCAFMRWYLLEYIIAVIKTILPRTVDLKIVEWKRALGKKWRKN